MDRAILIRYAEVGLKGGNRRQFEEALVREVRRAAGDMAGCRLDRPRGRLVLSCPEERVEDLCRRVACVPGVQSLSAAWRRAADFGAWAELLTGLLAARPAGPAPASFRVRARRPDKSFPMKSAEIEARMGALVLERFGRERFRVDLDAPEVDLGIEVGKDGAFVFLSRLDGPGGLPVGSAGKVLSLVSGGIDSPVASWQMIRRGCRVEFVFFENRPYLGAAAGQKVRRLVAILSRCQGPGVLHLVPFAPVQEAIRDHCNPRYRVVLYRRFMYRLAEAIGRETGALGLVTGESLGQVASQTLENLSAVDATVSCPVYRPLIGLDKLEIVGLARRIGTYGTSVEDAPDCCSVFLPDAPATRARREALEHEETRLDPAGLMAAALAGRERLLVEAAPWS